MTKSLFITGTDTHCGKTTVSCLILKGLQSKGLLTFGFKPIASGAQPASASLDLEPTAVGRPNMTTELGLKNSAMVNDDALCLSQASSQRLPYQRTNPYCFMPPIAPHIAAQQAGLRVSIKMLRQDFSTFKSSVASHNQQGQLPAIIVVEGAGGWAVPLNESELISDFAVVETIPVILVVAMQLGCINHALLTAQAIAAQGGVLVGWVANQVTATRMASYDETLAYLRRHITAPLVAEVPYLALPAQRSQWQLPTQALQKLLIATDCNRNPQLKQIYADA